MLTIIYSIDGVPNADGKSEELAWELFKNQTEYVTSTDSLITAFRLLIAEGKISHDDIRIVFDGENCKQMKTGN